MDIDFNILIIKAAYKCEYCKCDLKNDIYPMDHVLPADKNGPDDISNRAIACTRCNTNKGNKTHYLDPKSWEIVPLYNPRTMKWNEHFFFFNNEIRRKTKICRATCNLLFKISNSFTVGPKYNTGTDETIYNLINELRYLRLSNQFGKFQELYKSIDHVLEKNSVIKERDRNSLNLLQLEKNFTKSSVEELFRGIAFGLNLHIKNSEQRSEYWSMLGTLFAQKATKLFLENNSREAFYYQNLAVKLKYRAYNSRKNLNDKFHGFIKFVAHNNKFAKEGIDILSLNKLIVSSSKLPLSNQIDTFKYLIDLTYNLRLNINNLESLYEKTTDLLEYAGYGYVLNVASAITLRRRWWLLHFLYEKHPEIDMLLKDLQFWKRKEMFNEIRELNFLLLSPMLLDRTRREIFNNVPKGTLLSLN